jgi:hypothetical protein
MKYFLVFYKDSGSREGANVYYSWLTQARSEKDAIAKVSTKMDIPATELDSEEMNLIK